MRKLIVSIILTAARFRAMVSAAFVYSEGLAMGWALKTTRGSNGQCEWPMFVKDGVVAIGWHQIDVNPATADRATLMAAAADAYPAERSANVVRCLNDFVGFNIGDLVLICRGYTSNQIKDVRVFGYAKITGRFVCQPRNGQQDHEWRFKRTANIQLIQKNVPVAEMRYALDRKAFRGTVHRNIDVQAFANVIGVPVTL